MKPNYLWTSSGARLRCIRSACDGNVNWIFLPGGPGLGSESLRGLTQILKMPGMIWHLDLPGDGSNTKTDSGFSHWSRALVEAVKALPNVILAAHSTGGMYALSTPALSRLLTGLVLMDTAPDASWQNRFMQFAVNHPIDGITELQKKYIKKPSNALLKQITVASAPYSFTKRGLRKGVALFKSLPFNYKACEWSAKHFDSTYRAKWVPDNMPVLIFAGAKDRIIPLDFFIASKKFQRKNIVFLRIKDAGHYPWIENPGQVAEAFNQYSRIVMARSAEKKGRR
ncbi:2-succinyl-6-hydroxy-2, 4-cyclohexadiene-1-carboxylate synthase [Aquicella siphonis]|uniref:2-succinyl-6-hydroxy-2, 4-cyclohexadiene-1-carboxylate synthase n=1 Tax=Aquicella siphonis TaxID=254247 RepID=A0A5E4PL12_9COXI|nr:alpha/beta hydrolase [Aquicella siphonis]VVC77225.1 2-succinyl-6-hydroxy-2, 4-cyclohexadiene-1-carboxylate synthase [Aquicella siphonis]